MSRAAEERWVEEPPKRPGRTAYERDRARVLHSSALRRLAAKTQVVVPGGERLPAHPADPLAGVRADRPRPRQGARCRPRPGRDGLPGPRPRPPAVRAHRRGRAGRGRAGCGGFEGNAQSLRILTRLEAKTFSPDGRSVGLNLTRAALDAACKYPWPRAVDSRQVRRVRRRPRRLPVAARGCAGRPALPRGAGHGLVGRHRLLGARPRGRGRGRPPRARPAPRPRRARCAGWH